MYDRELLWSTLTGFTRSIVGPYDVDTMLTDLTGAATDLLRLLGSGVALIKDERLTFATCVPAGLATLGQAQELTQAGPGMQACRSGEVVSVPDLSFRAQEWGAYCAAGAGAGVLAVAGIPMTLGETPFGGLILLPDQPRQWSADDLAIAQVLADLATGYLINASQLSQHQQLSEQLQNALDSRIIIEQAKGMLAVTHGISMQAAFNLIRSHARRHHAALRSVAEAVVNLGLTIDADPAPPGAASPPRTEHRPAATAGDC